MGKIVSVVIPTYGGPDCLERSINSVLEQTYQDIEILVVDDNGIGTEAQIETARVMSKYDNEKKVKYICHEINRNGSAARNTGVRNAKGEFVSLLDDDDEFIPTKIENLIRVLDKLPEEYALVFGNAQGYDGDELVYSNKAQITPNPLYDILLHNFSIGTSAFLIRRSAYEKVGGFDEDFKRHQDWEFFCKIIANFKIMAVDTPASIRHLTRRNRPKSVDTLLEYRIFYLLKMSPYIERLTTKEQKDVQVYNILDVLIQYLPQKRFGDFFRYYKQLKPGYRGLFFFIRRTVVVIKRGSLRGKQ